MTRARINHPDLPACLQTWMLLDDYGLPRFWPAVWQSSAGTHLAESTLGSALSAIDGFYKAVEEQTGRDCLDRVIADTDCRTLSGLLQGYYSTLRNRAAQNGTNTDSQWQTAVSFVKTLVDGLKPGTERSTEIDRAIAGLEGLYGQLRPSKGKPGGRVRALPVSVVEDIYDVIDPRSPRNPFRTEATRWRNFVLVLILLHQGLRRGEAGILPCNAIHDGVCPKSGEMITWVNVTGPVGEEDPRYEKPSLKTALSQRQIPISGDIVAAIDHYVENFRGKPNHPFLFSSSRDLPLALPTMNGILRVLTDALSDRAMADLRARNATDTLSPHDFRHTCAVVRLSEFVDDGQEMKLALQSLRAFFGWSLTSKMPNLYAEAYFEDGLKAVWRKKEDDRTEVLRQLRKIERQDGVLSPSRADGGSRDE